ncbi:tetratricopeptide repeat-containing sensor histidine kinase [Flavobacterium sp.]|uniref:tetratricopeptide repeat-containing sensor histidine kinase n=1 Tax=Flavobacterium sp. TaxID=239 RepID=UPI00404752BF
MKFFKILFLFLQLPILVSSQEVSEFEIVKKRISETFRVNPQSAKNDAFLLKKIAKNEEEKNSSYQYLGYIYDLTGNVDSARYYFQKRLNLSKEQFSNTDAYYQSVIDYVNWGVSYVDTNALMTELTQALLKINVNKNPQEKGLMYLLMGDLLLRENRLDKANDYYDKSFSLIKGKFVASDYYLRKSEVNIKRREYEEAKENLLKGIASFDEKETYAYPLYLNKLGYVFLMLGDVENSNQHLYESLHYQRNNNFLSLSSSTYLNLYYLSKIQKNERLEKFNLDKALELNQGDITILKDIYLAYKEYYSKQGDFLKESESLLKFNQINDSIFNIEKARIGTDLEFRFQLRENKKELELKEKIIQKESRIKMLLVVSFLILFLMLIALMIIYYHKIKTQKKLRKNQNLLHEEQLKATLETQKTEIIKEKIKAKFEEREKISLELHDGIANEIGALKVSLTSEEILDKSNINSIVDKIDKLYNEVRDMSHELSPDRILDVEFTQLINCLCLMVEKNGIKTTKNILISKKINALDDSVLLSIYRILQEAMNNVVKHASATEIQVDIVELEEELLLQIKDNGVGFSKNNSRSGIGLKNIEKRVEVLKGKFEINSSGKGVSLEIKLPL